MLAPRGVNVAYDQRARGDVPDGTAQRTRVGQCLLPERESGSSVAVRSVPAARQEGDHSLDQQKEEHERRRRGDADGGDPRAPVHLWCGDVDVRVTDRPAAAGADHVPAERKIRYDRPQVEGAVSCSPRAAELGIAQPDGQRLTGAAARPAIWMSAPGRPTSGPLTAAGRWKAGGSRCRGWGRRGLVTGLGEATRRRGCGITGGGVTGGGVYGRWGDRRRRDGESTVAVASRYVSPCCCWGWTDDGLSSRSARRRRGEHRLQLKSTVPPSA